MATITRYMIVSANRRFMHDRSYAENAWADIQEVLGLDDGSESLEKANEKIARHPEWPADMRPIKITIEDVQQ